jgi:hypothetical protein
MCRLWCLIVLIPATMIGLPGGVLRRPTSGPTPFALGGRLLVRSIVRRSATGEHARGPSGPTLQVTVTDLGSIMQGGRLLGMTCLVSGGLGATTGRFDDFRNIVRANPCTA